MKKEKSRRQWNSSLPAPTKPIARRSPKAGERKGGRTAVKKVNRKRKASRFVKHYGSKARVEWVKALGCEAHVILPNAPLGFSHRIDNAHAWKDGGVKGPPESIVPLCRACHMAYDEYLAPFDTEDAREKVKAHAADVERRWLNHLAEQAA